MSEQHWIIADDGKSRIGCVAKSIIIEGVKCHIREDYPYWIVTHVGTGGAVSRRLDRKMAIDSAKERIKGLGKNPGKKMREAVKLIRQGQFMEARECLTLRPSR